MLEHALRVRSGAALYAMPTVDFAPYPYPPLFYGLGAALMGILGESLGALRVVSLVGVVLVLGSILLSFRWLPGWAACGVFAATYGWTGFWLDVARVDSLALGLSAVSFALVLRAEAASRRSEAAITSATLAGATSALAILAKQTQLGLAVALGIALLARSRAAGGAYALALALVLVPSVLWLQAISDGGFLWTTIDLLRGSPFYEPAILGFWIESAWVLALPLALTALARACGDRGEMTPCLALGALALVFTGWLGRAHEGGFDNTLLPVALASAFVSASALRVLLAARNPQGPWLGTVTTVGLMAVIMEDPRAAMPTDADHDAYTAAAAEVEALLAEGEVWQPISALPATAAGFANKMAIVDLAKSQEVEEAQRFVLELQTALSAQRFTAIILDGPPREQWGNLGSMIEASYRVLGPLDTLPPAPLTGAKVTPRLVLVPRSR